ncbi:hypothetical protein [Frankia sp. CiP3]|uniref:hypothetical protein n=1 Tax=Frankia sp. CiP3 TaxID=2880971 RepID=UPI001EF3DFC7|nr:hypothetical protein [Frankia sp. CiP3]
MLLSTVSGVLLGELDAGWPWIAAATVVVLISVVLAGWMASAEAPRRRTGSYWVRVRSSPAGH